MKTVLADSSVAVTVEKNPRPIKIPLYEVKKGWTVKFDGKDMKVSVNKPLKPGSGFTGYARLTDKMNKKRHDFRYRANHTIQVVARNS